MDGFDTNEGVILIAATNRPDVLDKALLDQVVLIDVLSSISLILKDALRFLKCMQKDQARCYSRFNGYRSKYTRCSGADLEYP